MRTTHSLVNDAARLLEAHGYGGRAAALRLCLEGIPSTPLAEQPIPMVLHCPKCGEQHVDAPSPGWNNPPHRSHRCERCACVWRPADVATVGVRSIETHGKEDDWKLARAQRAVIPRPDLMDALARTLNLRSAENGSNTPDYVLAGLLEGCLNAFDAAVRERERYYGRGPERPVVP